MKLNIIHNGSFSGVIGSLISAWKRNCINLDIEAHDLFDRERGGILYKLRLTPIAIRKVGLSALWRQDGYFWDQINSSIFEIHRLEKMVDSIRMKSTYFDFALVVGTILPGYMLRKPYFVYTDHPILANLYFPKGEERVIFWNDILPFEKRNLKNATAIFTMSSHAEKAFKEKYDIPPNKIIRVNAGPNATPPIICDSRRFSNKMILFVGLDWERKGGPELIEAFKIIRNKIPEVILTILGCSPRLNIPGVNVLGEVPASKVSEYLGRATVFCMPSKREPFGIVFLEALQAGLPVVCLDLGAAPDFVINGKTGYRVPANDIFALSNALLKLINNPMECYKLGKSGEKIVESSYNWDKTQEKMWRGIKDKLNI